MEYGHFKRRDNRDFRDRDRGDNRDRGYDRDRGYNRDRGGDYRDRGGFRDRGDFRDRDRGGFRDRGSFDRDRGEREQEESVFSKRVRAGKRRTYFLDVKKTRGNDYFITITESTRREDGYGYKRHKIFLYKEDFNRFVASLNEVVNHVKTDLMPDFDYEEFDRRQAEWEANNRDMEDEDFRDEETDEIEDRVETDEIEEEEKDEAPEEKKSRKKKDEIDDEDDWKL
ncbi:MAG: DUF3276 family protein [Saprospiraceae bacterium]|nr:DUF3276 family protein [Saprospiraceae bacterium]